jgi:hypothetical protein
MVIWEKEVKALASVGLERAVGTVWEMVIWEKEVKVPETAVLAQEVPAREVSDLI